MNNVYITAIKQISAQQPLVDDWFESPVLYSEQFIRALEPEYKQFFTPNEVRRLGKILKRSLVVSRLAMSESGVLKPDAIITGTGLGCIENTEIFLEKLVREGEEFLNPTYFMQSTHNTISSLIAIDTKCNAYNITYSHKGVSFESALMDAFLQFKNEERPISTALVGAHDEMTPVYFGFLKKAGYFGKQGQTFAGETSVAMMLSAEKSDDSFCEIEAVEKFYTDHNCVPSFSNCAQPQRHCGLDTQPPQLSDTAKTSNIDAIMVGTNGVKQNDKIYYENCAKLFPNIPLLQYKHIFGECYTAPALGIYAAAVCLKNGEIPNHLFLESKAGNQIQKPVKKILVYNHVEGKNHSMILLSAN